MHGGAVTGLALSADHRTLFSVGTDGNVFMYSVHPEGGDPPARLAAPAAIIPVSAALEPYASRALRLLGVRSGQDNTSFLDKLIIEEVVLADFYV